MFSFGTRLYLSKSAMEKHYENRAAPTSLPKNSAEFAKDPAVMQAVARARERYLPWDEFKHKNWVPGSKEEMWGLVKLLRNLDREFTPIVDERMTPYTFSSRLHAEFLHEVDLELGGNSSLDFRTSARGTSAASFAAT